MDENLNTEILQRAAQRASGRPSFVAAALSIYQAQENIGQEQLAAFLGCPPQNLPKLALCRCPNSSASSFRNEVKQIAEYAGVQQVRLAKLFRSVDSIAALQSAPSSPSYLSSEAFLVAARDRDEDEVNAEQSETERPTTNKPKSDMT